MTSHLTRAATAVLAAALMLSAFAGAALAAVSEPPNEDFSFAERGLTAQAYWESCDEPDAAGVTRCESTQLYIFDGRQRSNDEFGHANSALGYLCVYHQTVAIDQDGYPVEPSLVEQGCSNDPQLAVVDTLESVTAAVPSLELEVATCTFDPETGEGSCEPGETRSVSVGAEFTGIGDIASQRWNSKSRSVYEGVRCSYSSSGSGVSRDATASATIDDVAFGPTYAQLSDGKTRFAQNCS